MLVYPIRLPLQRHGVGISSPATVTLRELTLCVTKNELMKMPIRGTEACFVSWFRQAPSHTVPPSIEKNEHVSC